MSQVNLNSDLKEERDLKSRYCFTLRWTGLNPNVGRYASICVTFEYAWIDVKHNVPK